MESVHCPTPCNPYGQWLNPKSTPPRSRIQVERRTDGWEPASRHNDRSFMDRSFVREALLE